MLTDTSSSTGVYAHTGTKPNAATASLLTPGAGLAGVESATAMQVVAPSGNATYTATYKVFMDTSTTRTFGTYTYTINVNPYDPALNTTNAKTVDVSIVIAAPDTSASPAYSTAYLSSGSTFAAGTVDSVVAVANTASTTASAIIKVTLADASGVTTYTNESLTVVTTLGTVGGASNTATGGASIGRAVTFNYVANAPFYIAVYPDGTNGTAEISISTTNVTFTKKYVTFYSTTVASIAATKRSNVLAVGSNSAVVTGVAKDSAGNVVGASTAVYAYSSNTAVVSDSGTACTYNSTLQRHECTLTGVAAGTATITLRNSGTKGAAATVSSTDAISVTVNSNNAAVLKMAWEKSAYAPGEKARLFVWAADSAGNPVGPQTISNLISSTGISRNVEFSGAATTWTNTSYALAQKDAVADGYENLNPVYAYTVYMPYTGGTVTMTATGGASLPVAGQVAVSASTTVTDNAATALAAVTALASQVSAFITKINAQITTLTDLVMKIQKKVKA